MGFAKITNPDAKSIASTARISWNRLYRIRGQGYDSASVMSGVHSGVQTLIKEMVLFPVLFVHCGCHNLKLVINDAVDSVVDNPNIFDVLGEIFSFFRQSLNRWEELRIQDDRGSLTLKKQCETR